MTLLEFLLLYKCSLLVKETCFELAPNKNTVEPANTWPVVVWNLNIHQRIYFLMHSKHLQYQYQVRLPRLSHQIADS